MKKITAIIPARYDSSRFPGKPLAMIAGKPMIRRVYETAAQIEGISVYVATDDERIKKAVEGFGGKAIMTGEASCGTERVYNAVKDMECDIVLNIQGDEPLLKKETICRLLEAFRDESVRMATVKKEIYTQEELNDVSTPKLITDKNDNVIYFSRTKIPYQADPQGKVKYYKHIGIYGYTRDFLETFVALPVSGLEITEKLEQLRALENGYQIRAVETEYDSIGVDLPEQIKLVEKEIQRRNGGEV